MRRALAMLKSTMLSTTSKAALLARAVARYRPVRGSRQRPPAIVIPTPKAEPVCELQLEPALALPTTTSVDPVCPAVSNDDLGDEVEVAVPPAPSPNAKKSCFLSLTNCCLYELPQTIPGQARCIVKLSNEIVEMPPLDGMCRRVLSSVDLRENTPTQPWHQNSFISCEPALFELDNAIVHGAVGITGLSQLVVAETLWHTAVDRHRYELTESGCILQFDDLKTLRGRHVSILTGAAESYWHAVFDATARLGIVSSEIWNSVDGLLIPSTGVRQEEQVSLYGVPSHVNVRVIEPHETLLVETLILPSSMHILFDYHPRLLNAVFDRILQAVAVSETRRRRIFIDRRSSGLRRLLNEDAVIAHLVPFGFEAIQIETLSVAEQATLFSEAEIVVAPHGAGLTNIGFCRKGTPVIELMMDAYLNWCYRRIAAIRALDYRCVIGFSAESVAAAIEVVHWRTWTIDPEVVASEVASAIEKARLAQTVT